MKTLITLTFVTFTSACGGDAAESQYTALVAAQEAACEGAEAAAEEELDCGEGRPRECTTEDFTKIDCIRTLCGKLSAAAIDAMGGE